MSNLYIESRLQAIRDIASASCIDKKDADNISSFCDEIYSAIPDIDKVVDELKEIKDTHESNIGVYCATDRAIEIVKQGGVSDDCCEWQIDGDMAINPHNLSKYKIKEYDGLYSLGTCRHCGKKIKVVEE